MVHFARTCLASVFLVLSAAFLFAWIHSYQARTYISASYDSDRMRVGMGSDSGQIMWSWNRRVPSDTTWIWRTRTHEDMEFMKRLMAGRKIWPPEPSLFCFSYYIRDDNWAFVTPSWLPVVILAAVAVALKPRPKLKFNSRDLLILISVSAIVLTVLILWMRIAAPRPR